jgi:hypothetical protein
MKNAEFLALIATNTNKTTHIRTYSGCWYTGVSRIPEELTTKIGKIIALLQAKINQGQLCDKSKECLLIYNFQPASVSHNHLFCTLDMLVKPLADIQKTDQNIGKPLQLIIDGNTSQVVNNTKGMIDMGLITESEAKEDDLDPPIVYGNYHDFKAICCFAALASYRPINDIVALFRGDLDQGESMQQSIAFDSWIEAHRYLSNKIELGRYILEIIGAKEDFPHLLKSGVSKQLLKVINFFDLCITVTPYAEVSRQEDKLEDQAQRFDQIKNESGLDTISRKKLIEEADAELKQCRTLLPPVERAQIKSTSEENTERNDIKQELERPYLSHSPYS